MGSFDINLGPLIVLATIGLLALGGGAIWLAVLLIGHVRLVLV